MNDILYKTPGGFMFRKRSRSGQSTVEYILLVTAVIGVMIFFLTNSNGLQGKLNSTLGTASNGIEDMSNRLHNSQAASGNAASPGPGVHVDPTAGF